LGLDVENPASVTFALVVFGDGEVFDVGKFIKLPCRN
jgi:hypothetical protein